MAEQVQSRRSWLFKHAESILAAIVVAIITTIVTTAISSQTAELSAVISEHTYIQPWVDEQRTPLSTGPVSDWVSTIQKEQELICEDLFKKTVSAPLEATRKKIGEAIPRVQSALILASTADPSEPARQDLTDALKQCLEPLKAVHNLDPYMPSLAGASLAERMPSGLAAIDSLARWTVDQQHRLWTISVTNSGDKLATNVRLDIGTFHLAEIVRPNGVEKVKQGPLSVGTMQPGEARYIVVWKPGAFRPDGKLTHDEGYGEVVRTYRVSGLWDSFDETLPAGWKIVLFPILPLAIFFLLAMIFNAGVVHGERKPKSPPAQE